MRRFKKMCEKEGLTKDIKRRMYYEKPSEKRQRALRKSLKRIEAQEAGTNGRFGAVRNSQSPQYCDACFTGDYPIRLSDREGNQPAQLTLLAELA